MTSVADIAAYGFNPRARDGREYALPKALDAEHVSIHAPVMDAKTCFWVSIFNSTVSIHAPVMDAKQLLQIIAPMVRFNPRARDGREKMLYLLLLMP